MKTVRRVAAHRVVTDQGTTDMGVVEIVDGNVVSIYPLQGEQAATEWLPGTICIKQENLTFKAYYKEKPIK